MSQSARVTRAIRAYLRFAGLDRAPRWYFSLLAAAFAVFVVTIALARFQGAGFLVVFAVAVGGSAAMRERSGAPGGSDS